MLNSFLLIAYQINVTIKIITLTPENQTVFIYSLATAYNKVHSSCNITIMFVRV